MNKIVVILSMLSSFAWAQNFHIDAATKLISDRENGKFEVVSKTNAKQTVLWWNVLISGSKVTIGSKNIVKENLKAFFQNNKPTILVLGEYVSNADTQDLIGLIRNHYKYVQLLQYTDGGAMFLIAADEKFQVVKNEDLGWNKTAELKKKWENICLKTKRTRNQTCPNFNRKYVRIEFSWGNNSEKLSLFPIHFLNPWDIYEKYLGQKGQGKVQKAFNFLDETYFETDNPLNHQVDLYRDQLAKDVLSTYELLIGDFNAPARLRPVPLRAKALQFFDDTFFSQVNNGHSFPSDYFKNGGSLSRVPRTRIDHAYTNRALAKKIRAAKILPLAGSDHYPLYLVID